MSSSATRLLLAAIVVTLPISCSSAPEDLFSSGGAAGASSTGGWKAGTGGWKASGGAAALITGGASSSTGGAWLGTGGTNGGTGGAGKGGALATGGVGGQVATLNLELSIQAPTDDCTWINGYEERLLFSAAEPALEVGTDAEMGRTGLRFSLPIAAGSRIVSAILRLYRVAGETVDTGTLAIQVFDIANVSPFDASHIHAPAAHASGGLWSIKATGMPVGRVNQFTQSPDLSPLIQHVIDKPDWLPGGAVGFVLGPEAMTGWVHYADSSAGLARAASLRLSYVPQ